MRRLALASLLLLTCAGAQEIDTAIGHTPSGRFTILDQIDNPKERGAFTRLYRQRNPSRRRDLAAAFIRNYPSSWLLAEAYETAAKASIDLDDFSAALDNGAKSLRLWPENALLLVPIADVQARMKLQDAAVASAKAALWCLQRFDRPASIRDKDWPALQDSLRASAYFVLGRVSAARGLAAVGQARAGSLAEAARWLEESLKLDRRDPETLYLMGLVSMGQGRPESAAACFAETWRLHRTLESEALSQLKTIYHASASVNAVAFELWLKSLRLVLPEPARAPSVAAYSSGYAGSQSCASCHEQEYKSWKETGMSRMFRRYRPEDVQGTFSGAPVLLDNAGAPAVRTLTDRGRHYIDVRAEGGEWRRYPVDYVIGSKWQQAYATVFPGGEIQVFPVQFNLLRQTWTNYWNTIDPPGSSRTEPRLFAAAVSSGTYQFNCAPCHTSQLRFARGKLRPGGASFAEGGINCEMCHGPSGRHAVGMRDHGRSDTGAAATPVDFKRLDAERYIAICAQCHMQSTAHAPEKDGGVNYSDAGPEFYRVSLSRPYIDFSRKAFYKDGRFRVTTFIVESFIRSACFRKGGATCGSCHDPHPRNAASNPVSLKFSAESDEMCVQCHKDSRLKSARHTSHSSTAEASRCISCHMPRIMEAVLFSARSHQIDDIPDPEMTARFGKAESPNACLLCHTDKDAVWLRSRAPVDVRLP